MVRVKICGITSLRDAWAALDAGADALGFNFHAASTRKVSPGEARAIIRTLPPLAPAFGVFVDESPRRMADLAAACGLAFLQVHGRPPEDPEALPVPVVPAVRVRSARDLQRAARLNAKLLLLDRFDPRRAGGTGRAFDWSLLARTRPPTPFLLAGGLTPSNVRRAIRATAPYGVDVCSGVESAPGVKDPRKVRAFVRAAKSA